MSKQAGMKKIGAPLRRWGDASLERGEEFQITRISIFDIVYVVGVQRVK